MFILRTWDLGSDWQLRPSPTKSKAPPTPPPKKINCLRWDSGNVFCVAPWFTLLILDVSVCVYLSTWRIRDSSRAWSWSCGRAGGGHPAPQCWRSSRGRTTEFPKIILLFVCFLHTDPAILLIELDFNEKNVLINIFFKQTGRYFHKNFTSLFSF